MFDLRGEEEHHDEAHRVGPLVPVGVVVVVVVIVIKVQLSERTSGAAQKVGAQRCDVA